MAGGGYDRQRERLAGSNVSEQSKEEIQSEFVEVPRDLKGVVFGRGGCVIQEIRQKSGAKVISKNRDEEGFTVSGDEGQRACAKKLILEKVVTQKRNSEEVPPGELVEVPKGYKGLVFGKLGQNLKDISKYTGAEVIRKNGEVYIVSGTEEQRQKAKLHIKDKIVGARLRGVENEFNKFCVYIDRWNLPEDCKFKLEQVKQGDRIRIPETYTQYRLKPAEHYDHQENCSPTTDPIYLSKLVNDALQSLRKIKQEMKTKQYLEADMWCHFGKAIIRGPDKDEADQGRWTIDEATNKFINKLLEGNCWKTALKAGVKFSEQILERHVCVKTPEEYADYAARYDLAFLTPCSHQVIFKVWVTKKNVGRKVEDIPDPLSDVKNILDEIHFEDEATRLRCRGWLVLPSRKYLQADILFPGCEFDCRLTIRGRTDEALITDYVPGKEARQALAKYLSELTLTDEDGIGLCLPKEKIPEGFHLTYKRCSKRSVYEIRPGFTVIVSKESTWRTDGATEESRESTDFHLHCREWDELLHSGDWEPEIIIEKLPEFFGFVKEVQGIVLKRTVPPEILARGLAAQGAYNRALADGKAFSKRVPLMLIGQDRAGKTSLKKSLIGICCDPEEDSTIGIEVDPSHFKVSTKTWKTGTKNQDQNSDTAITFDFQTARCIVDSLKTESKSTEINTATEESPSSFDSEITKTQGDSTPAEPSRDAENIQTPRDPTLTPSRHIPHVSPDKTERNQEDVNVSTSSVPDEVAAVTETLLQVDLEDDGEDIYSTLWDFAGQSVYYVTHPLFLTKRAIYFLVYDLSLNPNDVAKPAVKQGVYEEIQESFNLKTNLDYLDFWMTSVASLADSQEEGLRSEVLPEKLPPVFLVCTHSDIPYDGGVPRKLALKIFGCLKRKSYGAHLCDVFFVDNTSLSVNNCDCPEVQRLRKEVLAVAKELPHVNEAIPIKWLKFEKALQAVKEKGHKCISLESAKDIASKVCDIVEGKEFETLMNYLHDLRRLIHFDDTAKLNKLIILDPQWLVDVFKKVITVKPYDRKEKNFTEELWCKLERDGILDEKLLVHVWGALFDNKETLDSLIGIMEKFSLLCSWPSDDSSNKNYLVPSMLKSHPPKKIVELIASAKIPSLFIKFENGQVPPGLFPRVVLQFFQWGNGKLWRPEKPQLFHNFARFFTTEDGYSVILVCHSSSVEVVVHGGEDAHLDAAEFTRTGVVRRQLRLMLECMRNEFPWLKSMKYEMSFICPVCCEGRAVDYCQTHGVQGCKQEQCLHFLTVSELCSAKEYLICTKSASAQNTSVRVMQFSPWFKGQQESYPLNSVGIPEVTAEECDPETSVTTLHVTLLASEWSSSMGGLSTINRKLAILLAKHTQVDVTLLVPQFACCEEDKTTASRHNVVIREAQSRAGYDPLDWLSSPPKDLVIDIILGHDAKLGKQAQFIKESRGCKWVQVAHTAPEELGMYKTYTGAIAKGEEKNRTEVELCKQADLVVAIGPKLKEAYSSYLRYNKKHIIQLTPGIFHEFTTIEQAAQEGEKFKVLTFGRGDSEDFSLKGYDIAAKAVVELKDSSYCLVFVGACSEKQEEVAEKLLQCGISKDQLIVRAFVQRLKELFCEVDLVVMPSRTEGFGLTALEALSAGLPILVSGNSGFGHALRDIPSGESFVVKSKDPKEWAKAIASVRQKGRAQRLQEIQTLRTTYDEKYNWENQCGILVEKLWSMVRET